MFKNFLLFFLISLFGVGLVHAQTPLYRTLKLGDVGSDVKFLQQLLNEDPQTTVATSGAGSPGAESGYFGLKTKLALARFQEKYASSTLIPAGLSRGTGF